MPQKKNPDPLELVRGKAGRVIGRCAGWLTTMKGLPIGYSKDLQEDKEALFDAEDTVAASLDATASVVAGLEINRRTTEAAASGLLLATDVADYLVGKGMPFREAHEVVGALVRRLLNEHRLFDSLSLDEWRTHSPLFDADVADGRHGGRFGGAETYSAVNESERRGDSAWGRARVDYPGRGLSRKSGREHIETGRGICRRPVSLVADDSPR